MPLFESEVISVCENVIGNRIGECHSISAVPPSEFYRTGFLGQIGEFAGEIGDEYRAQSVKVGIVGLTFVGDAHIVCRKQLFRKCALIGSERT